MTNSHEFVRSKYEAERAYLEALVRQDYDRCHQGETFDDMERPIPFSQGRSRLYRDWLAVAATRAAALSTEAAAKAAISPIAMPMP